MKSYRINKKEASSELKKQKKENALDIISKSTFHINPPVISSRPLNTFIMSTIRNKVQLIGNVGQTPEMTTLESGKKVVRFSLATNDYYKNEKGEKVQSTDWHRMVAWGRLAETIASYADKGKEIAVEGKLTSRSYENDKGEKRYVTEVVISEVLLLGSKKEIQTA